MTDIQKQIEKIERRIAKGETVEVDVKGGKKNGSDVSSAALEIDEKEGARKAAPEKPALGMTAGKKKKPAAETLELDFGKVEISKTEINKIIKEASEKNRTAKKKPALGLAPKDEFPRVVLERDGDVWVLFQACSYKTNGGATLTAPAGYRTDLASIPRIFWTLLASFELSLAAPVFHDLIYRTAGELPDGQVNPKTKKFQRKEADEIFLEIMEKAKIARWRRYAAYYAVRAFAAFAWKKHNL